MNIKIVLIVVATVISFVACGGASSTVAAEEKKSRLKQTEQNITFTKYDDGYYQVGQERKYEQSNEVLRDTVTGLEWQDTNETGDSDTIFDWAEAQSYCATLALNGQEDWRLPTVYELKTLVLYNKKYPAMTSSFKHIIADFEDGFNDEYWSSTLDASNSTLAWIVGSFYGDDHFYPIYNFAKVRCVIGEDRNVTIYERDDFLGTVADKTTNLIWQDDYRDNNNSVKQASYHDALSYCESLALGKKDDWRLPNINELYSLVDKERTYPALDSTFKKVVASNYWSSTSEIEYPENKWGIGFDFGDDGTWFNAQSDEHYVRCVRGGRELQLSKFEKSSLK